MVSFNASSKIFGTEVAKEFKDYWETKLLGDLVTVVPKHCTSWSSFGFTCIILFYFILFFGWITEKGNIFTKLLRVGSQDNN